MLYFPKYSLIYTLFIRIYSDIETYIEKCLLIEETNVYQDIFYKIYKA
jgi:hypothetical protein